MLRDFFLGFIKIHILHHAAHAPVFGLALIRELARHGYDVSPGTVYPILHELERAGYLSREDRVVRGKIRKYYRITPRGRRVLAEVRVKIAELVAEVLRGEGPSSLPDEDDVPE
ncbi:MAG TPA: PadR family transcriptional regulator [Alphaproteobacteria bacterium]|nr:PadR family transcriptional regulator [Alphaproteobacteria bacterium]